MIHSTRRPKADIMYQYDLKNVPRTAYRPLRRKPVGWNGDGDGDGARRFYIYMGREWFVAHSSKQDRQRQPSALGS